MPSVDDYLKFLTSYSPEVNHYKERSQQFPYLETISSKVLNMHNYSSILSIMSRPCDSSTKALINYSANELIVISKKDIVYHQKSTI